MDPKRRQNLMLLSAIALVTVFAADRLILTPQLEAWSVRSENIAKLREDLARARAQVAREPDLRSRWRESEKSMLPADQAGAENLILKSVNQWAREVRLNITSVKPRPLTGDQARRQLEFRASGRGSMEAVARFLWLLETAPLALHVEEIEIAGREKEQSKESADLSLDVRFTNLLANGGPRSAASAPVERAGASTAAPKSPPEEPSS